MNKNNQRVTVINNHGKDDISYLIYRITGPAVGYVTAANGFYTLRLNGLPKHRDGEIDIKIFLSEKEHNALTIGRMTEKLLPNLDALCDRV